MLLEPGVVLGTSCETMAAPTASGLRPRMGASANTGGFKMEPRSATRRLQLWIPLVQCAWCKAVKLGGNYLHLPMLRLLSGEWRVTLPGLPPVIATLSHSICRSCAASIAGRAAARRADRIAARTMVSTILREEVPQRDRVP